MKIELKELTTCDVASDGEAVKLNFTDAAGIPVCLQVPFDGAQSIAMTLPRLLTRALRRISGNDGARYVFPLESWSLAIVDERNCLVATFATEGGFEVSFGMAIEACRGLGATLRDEADNLERAADGGTDIPIRLN